VLLDETWVRWTRSLDSALTGGAQSTFVAAAVLGNVVVGVTAGDSRAYLVPLDGQTRLLSDQASKARLGSGETEPAVFRATLAPRDILILASDGAWGPLGPQGIDRAVRSALGRHFSEMPEVVLDAAGKRGRGDDMTVLALRLNPVG